MTFAVIALGICSLPFVYAAYVAWDFRRAQANGLYPRAGQATSDEDVIRLMMSGKKWLAIRLYGEIYHTDYRSAKQAVEERMRASRSG